MQCGVVQLAAAAIAAHAAINEGCTMAGIKQPSDRSHFLLPDLGEGLVEAELIEWASGLLTRRPVEQLFQ